MISLFPGKSGNKKAAKRLAKDIRQGVERAKTQYDLQDEDQDYNYGTMITKLCFVTLLYQLFYITTIGINLCNTRGGSPNNILLGALPPPH